MKTKLEEAYTYVGKGWRGLLDKYLPQIWAIDPNCDLIVKEKYGTLRIQPYKVSEGVSRNKIREIANKAERESAKICEICGKPGSPRIVDWWIVTICNQCFANPIPAEEVYSNLGISPEDIGNGEDVEIEL